MWGFQDGGDGSDDVRHGAVTAAWSAVVEMLTDVCRTAAQQRTGLGHFFVHFAAAKSGVPVHGELLSDKFMKVKVSIHPDGNLKKYFLHFWQNVPATRILVFRVQAVCV